MSYIQLYATFLVKVDEVSLKFRWTSIEFISIWCKVWTCVAHKMPKSLLLCTPSHITWKNLSCTSKSMCSTCTPVWELLIYSNLQIVIFYKIVILHLLSSSLYVFLAVFTDVRCFYNAGGFHRSSISMQTKTHLKVCVLINSITSTIASAHFCQTRWVILSHVLSDISMIHARERQLWLLNMTLTHLWVV